MVLVCPQLGCSAHFNLTSDDDGRKIRCKECGTQLLYDSGRITIVGDKSERERDDPLPSSAREPERERRPASRARQEKDEMSNHDRDGKPQSNILDPVFSGVFMAGIVITLVFLFLPIIDGAKLEKLEANAGDLEVAHEKEKRGLKAKMEKKLEAFDEKEQKLADRRSDLAERSDELNRRRINLSKKFDETEAKQIEVDQERLNKDQTGVREDEVALSAERTKVERGLEKDFREDKNKLKKQKKELDEKLEGIRLDEKAQSQNSTKRAIYWYDWGMMAGLILLSIGSLGFLSPSQNLVRRIVGAIVLVLVVKVAIAKISPESLSLFRF